MCPSQESGALKELFQIISSQFPQDDNPALERVVYDQVHKAASEAPGVTYESATVAGRPAIWIRPEGASPTHAMLYMHGGGYSFGSTQSHRKFSAHLAKACNTPALSIDYRLTPEHPYPAPLDDCVNAYKYLLDQGIPAKNIAIAGDSCGGCLSAAVPLAAIQRGLPVPGVSISMSPLYDQTASGPTFDSNEANDVLNTKPFVNKLAERYTNGNKELRKDPLVSPLFAPDFSVFPPTWISAAGHDMLLSDVEAFAEKLQKAGVEVVLKVHDQQQHVFEFMAGKAPEADMSIRDIGAWTREKIGS
ncbi:Esterase [Pseudocercospora fuligena]|uniref:Esterase n=1 Tax=Pseudocercospora fuligena TaxID=685502 RepID=A0A8H6RFP4_9PEZI|nr:Esterase [Pseudocercospora fuligena]